MTISLTKNFVNVVILIIIFKISLMKEPSEETFTNSEVKHSHIEKKNFKN